MQRTDNNQDSGLYRKEALDAFVNKELGKVTIRPKSAHIISGLVFGALFFMCLVFVFTQPIYKTSVVSGWVENDVKATSIRNKEAGSTVLNVFVKNGEIVNNGQLLATVIRPYASMLSQKQINEKLTIIEQKRIQNILVLKKQLDKASLLINGFSLDLSANEKRIQLLKEQQKQNEALSQSSVQLQNSIDTLAKKGLLSNQERTSHQVRLQNIKNQEIEISLTLQQLFSQNTQTLEKIEQTKLDISRLKESIKLVNIESNEQVLDFKQKVTINVVAPASGIIENLSLQKGDTLLVNQMLAHIRPQQSKYIVKLAIPNNIVHHLNSKSLIKVQVDGFPFQQFGSLKGKITYLDKTVMLPQNLTDKPISIKRPVYIANVEVTESQSISLLAGVPVSASIGMKQMTIFQWLMQPIAKSIFLQLGESSK